MAVDPLLLFILYQAITGPFFQPVGKSMCTSLLKDVARHDAMSALQGVRDGVSAKGTRAKEEVSMSSPTADSKELFGEFGADNEGFMVNIETQNRYQCFLCINVLVDARNKEHKENACGL